MPEGRAAARRNFPGSSIGIIPASSNITSKALVDFEEGMLLKLNINSKSASIMLASRGKKTDSIDTNTTDRFSQESCHIE